METASKSRRIQTSLLARLEKRALLWFAAHLPAWVNSDHLTLLGFGAMILASILYAISGEQPMLLHVVNLCIVLNWFGDSLDGTLARFRNRQRPNYGYYVDHMIDSLSLLFILAGLAYSGYMSERAALVLLVAYLLLSINTYLAASSLGEFQISFGKFSPTELRLLLIAGNLQLMRKPSVGILGDPILLFDLGGYIAAAGMIGLVLFLAVRNTWRLYHLERV